ncbi:MAG: glycosyltransferase family 4 protein [Nanoarchaeota archaeon]
MKDEKKQQRRKLLIATDNYAPRWDGIARFLEEVIPRLKETYQVKVIAPAFRGSVDRRESGVDVIRIPVHHFLFGDFQPAKFKYWKLRRHIKDADIVFTQTIGPVGGLALYIAHKLGKKTAAFIHSIEWELVPKALKSATLKRWSYPLMKKLTRYLYSKCDIVFVPSQNISDYLSWELSTVQKKVIHLGCDVEKFKPGKREEIKKALGISKNTIVIGYHGRLSREKDLVTLLRGFLRVQKNHDVVLLVVGDGVPNIKQMLKRPGVMLVGTKQNVVPYLQAMDIYCLTSLTETTCLSVLEAMSCELPVISTPVGFVKDYIKDGKNGLLSPLQDAYALAKKIDYLIQHPEVREELGKNARMTVAKKFNWDNTVKEIVEGIEETEAGKEEDIGEKPG